MRKLCFLSLFVLLLAVVGCDSLTGPEAAIKKLYKEKYEYFLEHESVKNLRVEILDLKDEGKFGSASVYVIYEHRYDNRRCKISEWLTRGRKCTAEKWDNKWDRLICDEGYAEVFTGKCWLVDMYSYTVALFQQKDLSLDEPFFILWDVWNDFEEDWFDKEVNEIKEYAFWKNGMRDVEKFLECSSSDLSGEEILRMIALNKYLKYGNCIDIYSYDENDITDVINELKGSEAISVLIDEAQQKAGK